MDKYPPVLSAKENAFRIDAGLAEKLGLNPEILVTSGPMDVGACALGSGVIEPGCCCSIIGTAALHEMVIDRPLEDDVHAGMTVAHVMEDRWLRLMASLAGTPNLEWAINIFGVALKRQAEEKQVSVYDSKFQKKWYDTCDEAERSQIGQASYQAFQAANRACIALWLVLLLLSYVLPIGLLPMAAVLLIWAVLQVSYILACIRLGARGA